MPYVVGTHRLSHRHARVVAQDITDPEFTLSEAGDVANTIVVVTFSEPIISGTDDYVSGVTIKINTVATVISAGNLQPGSLVVHYTIADEPDANDAITWEYADAGGNIADTSGNQLGDVAETAVDNNIGEHWYGDNIADSVHMVTTMD